MSALFLDIELSACLYYIHADTSAGKQNEEAEKLFQSVMLCYDCCDNYIRYHRDTRLLGIR